MNQVNLGFHKKMESLLHFFELNSISQIDAMIMCSMMMKTLFEAKNTPPNQVKEFCDSFLESYKRRNDG
jgi:hypothetical protein